MPKQRHSHRKHRSLNSSPPNDGEGGFDDSLLKFASLALEEGIPISRSDDATSSSAPLPEHESRGSRHEHKLLKQIGTAGEPAELVPQLADASLLSVNRTTRTTSTSTSTSTRSTSTSSSTIATVTPKSTKASSIWSTQTTFGGVANHSKNNRPKPEPKIKQLADAATASSTSAAESLAAKPQLYQVPVPARVQDNSIRLGGVRPVIYAENNSSPIRVVLEHDGSRLVPDHQNYYQEEVPNFGPSAVPTSAAGPSLSQAKPQYLRGTVEPIPVYPGGLSDSYQSPSSISDSYGFPPAASFYSHSSPISPTFSLNEYPIFGAYSPRSLPVSPSAPSPSHPISYSPAENTESQQYPYHHSGSRPRNLLLSRYPEAQGSSTTNSNSNNHNEAQLDEIRRLRSMILGSPYTPVQTSEVTRVVAIDCEMVGVGPVISTFHGKKERRSALARVSIVDYDGHVLLDTFVRPDEPVTDYRTAVSGIRSGDLTKDRAATPDFAKSVVKKIIKGRVLVGHDIRQDLKVLKLNHAAELTRDTQQCPDVKRKYGEDRRIGLKALCDAEFNVKIQQGEHSSITDSRATMALYRLFEARWEDELRMGGVRRNGVQFY